MTPRARTPMARQRFEVWLDDDPDPTVWEAIALIELFDRLLQTEPPPLHAVDVTIKIRRIG